MKTQSMAYGKIPRKKGTFGEKWELRPDDKVDQKKTFTKLGGAKKTVVSVKRSRTWGGGVSR